jgi:hypothetical protein
MAKQPSHAWRPLSRVRRSIEGLGPYPSLLVLAIPTSLIEPFKLAAVAIAGEGHWISGTIVIACAYAASLLVVERLFKIVKPKLLKLPWFARLWNWCVALRKRALGWLRSARDLVFCRS